MYSRKILRRMLPVEREEAKLINELESCLRRMKNRLPKIHQAELESLALRSKAKVYRDEQLSDAYIDYYGSQ